MNVFQMPPDTTFYPEADTRKALLHCRKTVLSAGGFTKPGVFPSPDMTTDLAWFLVALILEGIGLWALLGDTGLPLEYAISGLGVAVIFDLSCAYGHHRFSTGGLNVNEAKIALADVEGGEYRGKSRDQIEAIKRVLAAKNRNLRLLANVPLLIILVFAGFKIYGYTELHGGFDIKSLFILSSYLVVAFVHVRYTGYVLFTWPSWLPWTAKSRWDRDCTASSIAGTSSGKVQKRFDAPVAVEYTSDLGAQLNDIKIRVNNVNVHWLEIDWIESVKNLIIPEGPESESDRIQQINLTAALQHNDVNSNDKARVLLHKYPAQRKLRLRSMCILRDEDIERLVNMVSMESKRHLAIAGLAQQLEQISDIPKL